MKKQVVILLLFLLAIYGCLETEPVSTIPAIEFKSFELKQVIDTSLDNKILAGILEFSFIDGNADLGMDDTVPFPRDTFNLMNYNVILQPYEKRDSLYYIIPIDTTKPPPYYTIFYDQKFQRVGQNKTIKGNITINILYGIIPEFDTIRYEFYIFDRARNQSNIAVTSDIGFTGYRNGNNGTNGF